MKRPGTVISFEGPEFAGKGIQIERLEAYLKERGFTVVVAHEPGGTDYGEALRKLLKHPDASWDHRTPECEAFMFWASRAEFADKVIRPNIEAGHILIADRLHDSTTAYQGWGRFKGDADKLDWIHQNNKVALQGFVPRLTLFLNISIDTMHIRMAHGDPEKMAYFETQCDTKFFERVRQGYLDIATREPERFKIVDGEPSIDQVAEQIRTLVNQLLQITEGTEQ